MCGFDAFLHKSSNSARDYQRNSIVIPDQSNDGHAISTNRNQAIKPVRNSGGSQWLLVLFHKLIVVVVWFINRSFSCTKCLYT